MSRRTYTSSEVKDRWNRKHYEQVLFRVGIGGSVLIKELADSAGMSVAAYIRHLIIADAQASGFGDISADLGGGGKLSAAEILKQLTGLAE